MSLKITPPGSKSINNRVLILAALSKNSCQINNLALSDDTDYLISALKKLGIEIKKKGTQLTIKGNGGKFSNKNSNIYTGNAGTTTRFLTALSTLTENKIVIDGDERMRERPISALTDALNKLGAKIDNPTGCPPLTIHPQKLEGGKIQIPGNISSQYLSALLMVLPLAKIDSSIQITTALYSKPYVDITLKLIEKFGLKVHNKNYKIFKIPAKQKAKSPKKFTVEADASSASYIAAFAALNPQREILMENVFSESMQGDIAFLKFLKKMGCKIEKKREGILIKGPKKLKGLGTVDMNETPDLVMTFAVLAMFTNGNTKITNIENLRIKETDRLTALENEIKKFGIKVRTGKSFIEITGNPKLLSTPPLRKIEIKTYNDHRIAMAFGILKNHIPKLEIENPGCVSKSYKTFWQDLEKLIKAK